MSYKRNIPGNVAEATQLATNNKIQWVPVLSATGHPLMPCHPARARELVRKGLAVKILCKGVFCIKLTQRDKGDTQPVAIGVDPGSKMNGYSVKSSNHTYINIQQPAKNGNIVKKALAFRKMMKHNRRQRKTPYRSPRYNNRSRKNWVPPSTLSRWQWLYNTVAMLCKLYPIQHAVIEDVKAITKKNKHHWNQSFSPLMVGKNWLYKKLHLLGLEVHLEEGYTTAQLRVASDIKKDHRKLEFNFFTHAADAWVLANYAVGGHIWPDMNQLTKLFRLEYCRRQLHLVNPVKGGIRRRYGGTTLPNGIHKGTIVKYYHPKAKDTSHLAIVTGYADKVGYSLAPITGEGRYTQEGKLDRMKALYRSSWLWRFPWSHKGYSSRRTYLRDIVIAPVMVTRCYQ